MESASFAGMEHQRAPRSANRSQVYLPIRQKGNFPYPNDSSAANGRYAAVDAGCPRDATFSGRPVSNLHRFLEHTTPRVSSQFFPKTHVRDLSLKGCAASARHFFLLSDLWDCFDEWSAYGAGVPIVLNGRDTVMQYYVPYLSALQLYSSSANVHYTKNRRLGDDSDGSEMDFRDTASEASSDGEAEKVLAQNRGAVPPESIKDGPSAVTKTHGPWSSLDVREGILRDDDERWHAGHQPETLLYEYFETAGPSLRVPLYDKVGELARQFPPLKTLCSNDLSRSSWLSVAWYPIYRIPTGPTLKDLAACFLTYHSVSTLVADGGDTPGIGSQESSFSTPENQVALHPFGLASYKFRGAIWTSAGAADRHYAMTLQRSSDDWLKRLHVQHPDFEYFMSRCPPLRR